VTAEKKSWWSGVTGVITAVTAFVTAVGGLIALLVQLGVIGGNGTAAGEATTGSPPTMTNAASDWPVQANAICARSKCDRRAARTGSLDPAARLDAGNQALSINKRMIRDLSALPRPDERKVEVEEFLRLGAKLNEATEELLAAVRIGNASSAQDDASTLSRLGKLFDDSAIGLGATTCAEGASLTGVEFPDG
jgi:hypothetical protein